MFIMSTRFGHFPLNLFRPDNTLRIVRGKSAVGLVRNNMPGVMRRGTCPTLVGTLIPILVSCLRV